MLAGDAEAQGCGARRQTPPARRVHLRAGRVAAAGARAGHPWAREASESIMPVMKLARSWASFITCVMVMERASAIRPTRAVAAREQTDATPVREAAGCGAWRGARRRAQRSNVALRSGRSAEQRSRPKGCGARSKTRSGLRSRASPKGGAGQYCVRRLGGRRCIFLLCFSERSEAVEALVARTFSFLALDLISEMISPHALFFER